MQELSEKLNEAKAQNNFMESKQLIEYKRSSTLLKNYKLFLFYSKSIK